MEIWDVALGTCIIINCRWVCYYNTQYNTIKYTQTHKITHTHSKEHITQKLQNYKNY